MSKKIEMYLQILKAFLFTILFCCCSGAKNISENKFPFSKDDEQLFTLVQKQTFQYFWDGAEPNSGLARERFHADDIYPQNDKNIVTSGGAGFGVMAILVGIERGFYYPGTGMRTIGKDRSFP